MLCGHSVKRHEERDIFFVNVILIWNYMEIIIIILSLQNQIIKSDFTDILKVFNILKAGNNILYSVN